MIDKVQETHLYKWLCEKNSEFLGQVNEAIRYAETMLPLVNKVFVRMFLRFRIMRYGTGYAIPHFLSRE